MSETGRFDVAIVGYGPVGAGAAILLAQAGLRVVVLERTTDVLDLPRAVVLDGEVVRAFQRIGRAEEIVEILQPPRDPDTVTFTDSARRPHFGVELPPWGRNGWRDAAYFDQPELERLLRDMVARDPKIDVRLGHEVTALEDRGDEVQLSFVERASKRSSKLAAEYVIGCDGAASFVRRALGIAWESLGYDQDWLVVDIVQKEGADLPRATLQICDPARLTTFVCCRDPQRRWEFKLWPGETPEEMERPDTIRKLLDPWLPPEHYALRRAAVYQFHAATAARWRVGRIFLAGDAAHQTPPFLGQGLNAGFRDVINLAWKLPLVREGRADPTLLETYAAERDAHARDLVEWAVAIGRLMEALAAAESGGEQPGPSPEQRRSGYGQGRSAPPLRGGVVIAEQVERDTGAGQLLRQPKVRTGTGTECLLDDLLGPGFAVVGRDAAALARSPASQNVLDRLGASTVALDELEPVRGSFDSLFEKHAAAVVRPDRYVFGVTENPLSLDGLVERLAASLRLHR